MKKLLIILPGTFAFACGDAGNTTKDAATIEESVEKGTGEEISPQLVADSDFMERFDVDTVSSSTEINEREQQ